MARSVVSRTYDNGTAAMAAAAMSGEANWHRISAPYGVAISEQRNSIGGSIMAGVNNERWHGRNEWHRTMAGEWR